MRTRYHILACIIGLFLLWACETRTSTSGDLEHYISEDAQVVLKISNLAAFLEESNSNPIIAQFGTQGIYEATKHNFLQHIYPTGPSYLSMIRRNDSVQDLVLATKHAKDIFQLDSLSNKQVESLQYNDLKIERIT
ncbi:MAG: hypothetical protein R3359_09575, partial [Marinirhabdus sp.]|nr:hypothetical protein [Marinirhabdus sp.]